LITTFSKFAALIEFVFLKTNLNLLEIDVMLKMLKIGIIPLVSSFLLALPASAQFIGRGQTLNRGDVVNSNNGSYQLRLQNDGNLVLYPMPNGAPLWGSGTEGKAVEKAVMQGDGNFVLYGYGGRAVWGAGTEGTRATGAFVTDDGRFVILRGNNIVQEFP
jgi:hypothetical protein